MITEIGTKNGWTAYITYLQKLSYAISEKDLIIRKVLIRLRS